MTAYRYLESRTFEAVWIFALEDSYLKRLQGPTSHPAPFEPLLFELIGREIGGVMTPLPQPKEMVMTVNASGYHLFFGKERLSDQAQRALALDPGRYLIRVRGPYYQQVEFAVTLPMASPHQQDLLPASTYPFPAAGETLLRGGLFNPDGSGMAGATVEIAGLSNTYTVGENGQWVLWFAPGDDTITGERQVTITLPDGTVFNVPSVYAVIGRETSLRSTALRGHVLRNGVGVLSAVISITGFTQTVNTRGDGSWWYYFLPNQADQNVTVTATLPDGQNNSVAVQIVNGGTVRVPTFNFP